MHRAKQKRQHCEKQELQQHRQIALFSINQLNRSRASLNVVQIIKPVFRFSIDVFQVLKVRVEQVMTFRNDMMNNFTDTQKHLIHRFDEIEKSMIKLQDDLTVIQDNFQSNVVDLQNAFINKM